MFTVENSAHTSGPEAARAIVFCTSAVLVAPTRRPKPTPRSVALRTVAVPSPSTCIALAFAGVDLHTLSRNVARTRRHAVEFAAPPMLCESTRCAVTPVCRLSVYPKPLPVVSTLRSRTCEPAPITDSPVSLENSRRVNSSPAPCTSTLGVLITTNAERP